MSLGTGSGGGKGGLPPPSPAVTPPGMIEFTETANSAKSSNLGAFRHVKCVMVMIPSGLICQPMEAITMHAMMGNTNCECYPDYCNCNCSIPLHG